MSSTNPKDILEKNDIRLFSPEELNTIFTNLKQSIQTGAQRPKDAPVITDNPDGGLGAIPSGVEPITQEQINQVPNESIALTAACGGTNWIFTIARKNEDGSVDLADPVIKPIPETHRKHTFDSLMDVIGQHLAGVAKKYHVQDTHHLPIAVSFGFPQVNLRLENGDIDARITCGELPKKWYITDCSISVDPENQPSLTALLRAKLTKYGVQAPGRIVMVNDTVAVALDVQYDASEHKELPVGFVFGTGTNAAMYGDEEKGILNLEAGHSAPIEADDIYKIMEQRGYTNTEHAVMEHWTGGAHVPYRMAAALELLKEDFGDRWQEWAEEIIGNQHQALISDIAQGDFQYVYTLNPTPEEAGILQELAKWALAQAGQSIGIMLAATASAAGYTEGTAYVPYEGSLMKKGYMVEAYAVETLDTLIPGQDLHPYTASGMIGVAKLALVKSYNR